jgi:SPP1 gp7 family putative phage head morphogenesis protein
MAWDVEAKPVKPQAAIDWFKRKLALSPEEFAAISAQAQRQAFTVAGATNLSVVQNTLSSLQKALEDGETFASWQKRIPEELNTAWGSTKGWRSRTVFDTAIQSAYGAGRWQAAIESERPIWRLEAVLDGRTSKICLKAANFTAPKDDPAWKKLIPPLHHRCRTALVTLSNEQAQELGVSSDLSPSGAALGSRSKAPEVGDLGGFGLEPSASEWTPNAASYDPELWAAHKRSLAPREIQNVVNSAKQYGFEAVKDARAFQGVNADGIAAFVPDRNRIELNENHAYWTNPEQILQDCSSQHRDHLVRHEVAHGRMFRQDPETYYTLNTMKWNDILLEDAQLAATRVSVVAAETPGEFVSEVFAALEAGIKYDDDVMLLYKMLHGGLL